MNAATTVDRSQPAGLSSTPRGKWLRRSAHNVHSAPKGGCPAMDWQVVIQATIRHRA
jgi:hypothetical protein